MHYIFLCYVILMNYPFIILKDTTQEQPKGGVTHSNLCGKVHGAAMPLQACHPLAP